MFDTEAHPRRAIQGSAMLIAALAATLAADPAIASERALDHADALVQATDGGLLDACPIEGDHDLHDSWGWARSGGRRHQGIDVSAPRGTELYAVRDGIADFKRSNLGGKAVWIVTDEGDKFYYAHLDAFVGDDREVEAGELIGYVGSTGNAGGPHLHFETHPDGAVENPYPHVVDACTRPSNPLATAAADGESAIFAFVDQLRDAIEPGSNAPRSTLVR